MRKNLFYLDDMPMGMTTSALQYNGYTVHVVENYADAVSLAENQEFDVYLLDLQLGGQETGLDFAYKLRRDGCNKPIVIYTAAPEEVVDDINKHNIWLLDKAGGMGALLQLLEASTR